MHAAGLTCGGGWVPAGTAVHVPFEQTATSCKHGGGALGGQAVLHAAALPLMFVRKLLAVATGSASPQLLTHALLSKTSWQSVSTLHGNELYLPRSACRLPE